MNSELIFDIGVHTGQDTLFYLRKGFRVVGLEARADLCEIARKTAGDIGNGRLDLVQKALYHRSGDTVSFYVNDQKDDWGSLFRGAAEQDGSTAREIVVETITLQDLFKLYGTPYYIKCDIEGGDAIFVEQLMHAVERPKYVPSRPRPQTTSPSCVLPATTGSRSGINTRTPRCPSQILHWRGSIRACTSPMR